MSEQIGKYRIVERIGRGGMGTVYKAHDPVLDRLVALKVISGEGEAPEELKARFYREAQACAKLSHPNIVVVHDLGEDAGKLFIVMEFLDGQELKYLIERKALSLEEKLALMVQVCDGLHFAHQKGIIHRDIKPGNIFVLRNGQAKILDFGIARIAAGTDPGLTRTGLIMGTLRYMSPEQARGKVDHRADIFAVGAVFYELLASRPAFDSSDPLEILEKVRAEQPTPLTELDPTIPPELAAIVERALRKDPAQRFADLAQMRAQIEAVRRGFADEGDRLEAQVRGQIERLRGLQTALGRQLGGTLEDETIPMPTDRTGLDDLRALARELAGRVEGLQARLGQVEALEPAVTRGLELLRAGQAAAAVAELERVVRE
ncbi:MAG TPA: serine/threonine-protein kinase, partial [Methylomirabilota bacterium]|nr:serine/threonine-protein kinase [Methylomirabilota bacterium]